MSGAPPRLNGEGYARSLPPGLHSHKVRVANDVVVVNRERTRGTAPAGDFVGLRIFDVSKPGSPDVPPGAERVSSNDVYVDHRGLIYLIDRNRGLSILERL